MKIRRIVVQSNINIKREKKLKGIGSSGHNLSISINIITAERGGKKAIFIISVSCLWCNGNVNNCLIIPIHAWVSVKTKGKFNLKSCRQVLQDYHKRDEKCDKLVIHVKLSGLRWFQELRLYKTWVSDYVNLFQFHRPHKKPEILQDCRLSNLRTRWYMFLTSC